MDLLTLDTNVLRDWAWSENKANEERYGDDPKRKRVLRETFSVFRGLSDSGKCKFGVTTQIYTDYEKSVGELLSDIKDRIGAFEEVSLVSTSVSTFPIGFNLVFANLDEVQEILKDVFPNSKPYHKKYKKCYKDALQLYAHKAANRDCFITTDAAILRAGTVLISKWAVKVEKPENYINKWR